MSKTTLKDLQDQMRKILETRTTKKHNPSQVIKGEIKAKVRKEPTVKGILLMEEYSRGVYQGD